jgi:membrane protein implicated in regulation of membrane protease activity
VRNFEAEKKQGKYMIALGVIVMCISKLYIGNYWVLLGALVTAAGLLEWAVARYDSNKLTKPDGE